ncbi:hypothetical protein V5O48_017373 [Marasmius crinis-equi]|uniref:SGNH hydrolase-type esterase domain-containing protein n=1 Tax=Marasmius crinis-equi TaxID=585013 RepID=A0ABR3EP47_9AGAR
MFDVAQTIVIFGDSYSSPPSWVDHLKSDHLKDSPKIHNFAFPGATTEDDLEDQLIEYLSLPGKPRTSSPQTTLYVFFFGINDCGGNQECFLSEIVKKIPEASDRLYTEAGARNFIFFDVPPTDRSPAGLPYPETTHARIKTWNEELRTRISQFTEDAPTAKVALFSVHDVLSAILDAPEDYDFTEGDVTDEGGAIWADELHLTSNVHKIIAERTKDVF